MFCKKCQKLFSTRAKFLLHASTCKQADVHLGLSNPSATFTSSDEEKDTEFEDTDDTDADPTWIQSPESKHLDDTPLSSPVTDEQRRIADEAELIMNSEPVICEPLNQFQEVSNSRLQKDSLEGLQSKINEWKRKRKLAFQEGKRGAARRLSKNLKRYNDLLKQIDPPTADKVPEEPSDSSSQNQLHSGNSECLELHEPMIKPNRKRNFCIYCNKLFSKFGEHLERCHQDKSEVFPLLEINTLNYSPQKKRIAKMKITYEIKKKWNSTYNKKIIANNPKEEIMEALIPVKRSSKAKRTVYVLCKHCDGLYSRRKLSVHLKTCSIYIGSSSDGKTNAIKQHSLPIIVNQDCVSEQFKKEILQGINVDNVMATALNDPLIMKFGSEFHESRREVSSKNYVIREIRDLARLYLEIKNLKPDVVSFRDCLSPSIFHKLIAAARKMSDYQEETGIVNVPSVAYRLTQPLKDIAKIVKTEELSKMYQSGNLDATKVKAIDDFLQLLQDNWSKKIGRICTKAQKFCKAGRNDKMALEADIIKVAAHIESNYNPLTKRLKNESGNKCETYDSLMHMLVTHIMLLIRRRPIDFKHAYLKHYDNLDKHDDLLEMANKGNCVDLGPEDFEMCKKFHIFFVPGKNLETVPMVLTPVMKSVLDSLINVRKSVGVTSDTLFVLSNNRPIKPNESIKMMSKKVKLKKPEDLTGNGLRHQAATFSKLHSTHPQYQDFLASALGHTLSVHKKHYDLPMGVLQKIMVVPTLNNIMTGQRKEREQVSQQLSPLEEPTDDSALLKTPEKFQEKNQLCQSLLLTPRRNSKSKVKWTENEEKITLTYFSKQVIDKKPPKRGEVVEFISKYKEILQNRTIAQVYMYIRNHCNRTQKYVTPKINKHLKSKMVTSKT